MLSVLFASWKRLWCSISKLVNYTQPLFGVTNGFFVTKTHHWRRNQTSFKVKSFTTMKSIASRNFVNNCFHIRSRICIAYQNTWYPHRFFGGVHIAQSLVSILCFVDCCSSFVIFAYPRFVSLFSTYELNVRLLYLSSLF